MPAIPAGDVCIRRLARTFDGVVQGGRPVRYKCGEVGTERMRASVTFRITAQMECDDVGTLVPITGLRARGTTVRRADGFAHFFGRAQIVNAAPEPDVVLFSGSLDLIARIGSHPALGEACAPEQHLEGWFVGKGQGGFAKMTLSAIFAGNGELATGPQALPDASANRVTGTLLIAP
jgi:hypothetical protein